MKQQHVLPRLDSESQVTLTSNSLFYPYVSGDFWLRESEGGSCFIITAWKYSLADLLSYNTRQIALTFWKACVISVLMGMSHYQYATTKKTQLGRYWERQHDGFSLLHPQWILQQAALCLQTTPQLWVAVCLTLFGSDCPRESQCLCWDPPLWSSEQANGIFNPLSVGCGGHLLRPDPTRQPDMNDSVEWVYVRKMMVQLQRRNNAVIMCDRLKNTYVLIGCLFPHTGPHHRTVN